MAEDLLGWTEIDTGTCSVARAVEILGDRWTVLVLREVFNGVRRFGDIQTHIGVSRSVLAQRLATLKEQGVLERRPYQEPGDRVRHEYRLTPLGRGLQPVLVALNNFGDQFLSGPDGPPVLLRHADCGALVSAALVCADDHRVGPREIRLELGPGARPRA
ncbi:MAG: helix-turn-helix transcriptional regulator [Euzebyales bacterium]|jgi:DNA-binding HxlR family transcriptional regulator|nr:helix-turn-helix transcriptional regulator [Euzebyales bacterium]